MEHGQYQNQAENEEGNQDSSRETESTDSECDEIYLVIEGAYFSDDSDLNTSSSENSLFDGYDNQNEHESEAVVVTPHSTVDYPSSTLYYSSVYSEDPFLASDSEDDRHSRTSLNDAASTFIPLNPQKRTNSRSCTSLDSQANHSPKRFCSRDLNQDEAK